MSPFGEAILEAPLDAPLGEMRWLGIACRGDICRGDICRGIACRGAPWNCRGAIWRGPGAA
jgi:hypothetical protein